MNTIKFISTVGILFLSIVVPAMAEEPPKAMIPNYDVGAQRVQIADFRARVYVDKTQSLGIEEIANNNITSKLMSSRFYH